MRDENTAVAAYNQGTSTTENRFGSSVESQLKLRMRPRSLQELMLARCSTYTASSP